jgi:hypothetical protein
MTTINHIAHYSIMIFWIDTKSTPSAKQSEVER